MKTIAPPPESVKPRKTRQLASTEFARRMARTLIADVTRGEVAGIPAGSKIEPSDQFGAELVTADGRRHPVTGRWFRARLLFWLDPEPIPAEYVGMVGGCQTGSADLDILTDWVVAEVQLSAESAAWHCEDLAPTATPPAVNGGAL